ncbi:hypothetical protein COY27_01095 [Candidatus Woesearchaeota archaeon CG_4_10_14_0_2_um_filter_33_13]|nr:MAG: hypothetical protein COY27_01095 [Candidatus Woesearchaeota archaeon CG_4_10_14_0_2_um_filter_33_13]
MQLLLPTNNVPFTLAIGIKTKQPEEIVIQIMDAHKPNTLYISRRTWVNGEREYFLNLPQSPKAAQVNVFNIKTENPRLKDDSFEITKIQPEELEQCPVWMNQETKSFVAFAKQFSENAGIYSAGEYTPHIYRSDDSKFHIDYFIKIFDRQTKQVLSTPARIGHATGVIEVAKADFINYTVPMRMIILLHEFAHKYLNPRINKPIGYEVGADINALNIYLSLGYPPSEAHYAFLHVFKDNNNADNAKRYLIIKDFIDKFTRGEIKGSCEFKTNNGNKK